MIVCHHHRRVVPATNRWCCVYY